MNYYPFHIGDYMVHTRHLSLMEDLAYRRILDLYYTRDGNLPAAAADVARLIAMRDHEAEVAAVMAEFFPEGCNKRADEELSKFRSMAEGGQRGAAKRWGSGADSPPIATLSPPDSPPISNQEPRTKNQEPKEKKPSASRARRCPADFDPGLLHLAQMRTECPGLDIERETAKFRDWEFKTARTDWQAAWRTWMRKAHEDRQTRAPPKSFRERDEAAAAARFAAFTGRGPDPLDVIEMETSNARIGNG